ncbi:MAG TPA: inorganic phosphate transporter [Myxococcota bacterium]|nr:inorganic phosphate transporter [Myxococcota bacterium]
MWQLVASVFLGWSLGSNDASNVFGTAVASRMVRFWTAAILCAVFVLLGAVLEGQHGIETYQRLSPISLNLAFIVSLAAALTVSLMSYWRLPVSTSQAVVGALVLIGALNSSLDTSSLTKVVLCWVGTPIGAALITFVLYFTVGKLINLIHPSLFAYDKNLRWALIVAGSYGAYALGANNVANVTGPFAGPGVLSPLAACLIGGSAIALGVLTYSKNVMLTVGKGLVRLDAYTAFIAILAEAVTVHIYAKIGVPVSTSQAVVGAVLGIGIIKGARTINRRTLWRILFGWIGTPAISAGLAYLLFMLFVALNLVSG